MLPMDRVIDCVFAFRLSHAARNPFQTQEKAGGVRAEMCGQVPSAERLLLVEWSGELRWSELRNSRSAETETPTSIINITISIALHRV